MPLRITWTSPKGELSFEPRYLTDSQLIENLIHYLNITEESDSGRVFRPNTISSCRVMDGDILGKILKELEARHAT